jgi:L-aspartate oxidase
MLKEYDVLIAGTGVAGLYTALNLNPSVRVLLVCKRELMLSNSSLAQGGVAAVLNKEDDNFKLHIADTLIAGNYKNNLAALEVLVSEGPDNVLNLMRLGVEFDQSNDGSLDMTLEGGHSRRRILHHKDSTGAEITDKLIAQVKRRPNIDILENTLLASLTPVEGGFCAGLLQDDKPIDVQAHFAVLATGGIGRIYKYTTNSAIATGDGIRLAYELGARIKDISLIQFHPTAFGAHPDRERFLISEAVRGEGAILLDHNCERFMSKYDERGELAPRDVVSHAIITHSRATGSEKFYLDISFKDADFLKSRFPGIYAHCLTEGIDITKDKIPIFPCQHYLMGGIDVDLYARTTIPSLYAVGECAHTGVHGQNRLASNSLLEALVFGRRAALDIMEKLPGERAIKAASTPWFTDGKPMVTGLRSELRELMQQAFFVIPNKEEAAAGAKRAGEIADYLKNGGFATTINHSEALSLATMVKLVLEEVSAQ